jgi:lysozyme family protein
MKENWPRASVFTFQWEGVNSHIVGDAGGRTLYGFCERYWPDQVKAMLDMTLDDAKAYALAQYKLHFWDAMGCDDLSYPMDCVAFDCSVNPGPGWTKRALIYQKTWQNLLTAREAHYQTIAHPNVLKGLLNRCEALRAKYQKEA